MFISSDVHGTVGCSRTGISHSFHIENSGSNFGRKSGSPLMFEKSWVHFAPRSL